MCSESFRTLPDGPGTSQCTGPVPILGEIYDPDGSFFIPKMRIT